MALKKEETTNEELVKTFVTAVGVTKVGKDFKDTFFEVVLEKFPVLHKSLSQQTC